MSAHRVRRTARPSLTRTAGRQEVRDSHPVQGTLISLAGTAILMGRRSPSTAVGRARARVQACEAQAAHRRVDRTHTHIHARARQSLVDARGP